MMATEMVRVRPNPQKEESWDTCGIVPGLSFSDYMARQRYVENSRMSCNHATSLVSYPGERAPTSSANIHQFIQEQRKIISNFRSQPWPMQMKLSALRTYSDNVSKYAQQMNSFDVFRDSAKMMCEKIIHSWKIMMQYLTIWNSIIKQIEGRFGSSVASFFTFLRWLCAINLLITVMVISVVVLPQSLAGHGLEVPNDVLRNGSAFSFFFDGKGYVFEYSVLFYGYYDSGQNEPYLPPPANPEPYIKFGYKLPLAYMLCTLFVFGSCIVAILFNMASKYKILQRASVTEQYLFSWKVFASWDHTVTNYETTLAKQRSTAISLKETIMEAKKLEDNSIKWKFLIIRVLSNLMVLVLLVVSSYVIYLAVQNLEATGSHGTSIRSAIQQGWAGLWLLIQSFQVQAVIIIRNMLLPYVFLLAAYLERFHPRTALKMMLLRLFLSYITSLYVLIIALLSLSRQCVSGGNSNSTLLESLSSFSFRSISDNSSSSSSNTTTMQQVASGDTCCWETIIGQELFKLSITYFCVELLSIAVADGLRWGIVQGKFFPRITKLIGLAEFRLAENILKLVYGQSLVWLGVFFCPLLPAINLIKCVVLFYIRAIVVAVFNKPPSIMFRVASTKNFYMIILLLMIFLCIFPVGFAFIQMTPSETCGPFRGLSSMISIIIDEIQSSPTWLKKTITYFQTPTVIIPLICLLCIIIYYYATKASALNEVNKDLRLQLHMEQEDARQRLAKDFQPDRLTIQQAAMQQELEQEEKARTTAQGTRARRQHPKMSVRTSPVADSGNTVESDWPVVYSNANNPTLKYESTRQTML